MIVLAKSTARSSGSPAPSAAWAGPWPRKSAALRIALAVIVAGLGGWAAYSFSFRQAVDELRAGASHRLDLYSAAFEREVNQFSDFPYVMGLDASVKALLIDPGNPRLQERINAYFARLNERIGTLDVYLLNTEGRVIASSNYDQPDSFIGRDLSYRPYFQRAGIDHVERFYGIGTTNRQPGYFLSTGIHEGPKMLGIGVVKVSLDQLEKSWSSAESPAILSDEHGVIVLSSIREWKYGTLAPLSAAARAAIVASQQFNDRALEPIGLKVVETIDADNAIVRLPDRPDGAAPSTSGLFLAESRAMAETPWKLTVYTSLTDADRLAMTKAGLAVLALLLVAGLVGAFELQRRHRKEREQAARALRHAHDHLEVLVAERTAALSAANAQLTREVGERKRAERTLREAQDSLVQAGKLAVLGQLSAGIAHEVNQPLAALGTLGGNAIKFLERGDIATARSNLERIEPLVQRLGRLTGELKSFARKSSGEAQRTDVAAMIDNTLFLLNHRTGRGRVSVKREIAAGLPAVRCDPNRIEQVLINVIGNALDAVEGQTGAEITVRAGRADAMVRIEVADNGPGLPADRMEAIFEPFFTTKASGLGLGLGLAISAGIMRDSGGELGAANRAEGGAVFFLTLPPWSEEAR